MKRRYTVIVAFTAGCCEKAHLWRESVMASSRGVAAIKVVESVEKSHASAEPHEVIVMEGSCDPDATVQDAGEWTRRHPKESA